MGLAKGYLRIRLRIGELAPVGLHARRVRDYYWRGRLWNDGREKLAFRGARGKIDGGWCRCARQSGFVPARSIPASASAALFRGSRACVARGCGLLVLGESSICFAVAFVLVFAFLVGVIYVLRSVVLDPDLIVVAIGVNVIRIVGNWVC